ncbi:hypothetical protein ACRRTK_012838 [Alexandromys fortis]
MPWAALPPRLKEMKSQESAAGSKLVLRCETSSEYSALRFKWFKNGNELNRKNKPQNIKIQKKPGKSELRIHKASLADSGEYMCKVISKLGNDSASANITIVDSNGKYLLRQALSRVANRVHHWHASLNRKSICVLRLSKNVNGLFGATLMTARKCQLPLTPFCGQVSECYKKCRSYNKDFLDVSFAHASLMHVRDKQE